MRCAQLFGCVLVVAVSTSCAAASGSPSASAEPSVVATPSVAASEIAESPTPSGSSLHEELYIVQVEGLNLREGPGTNEPIQTTGPGIPTSGDPIQLNSGDGFWMVEQAEVGNETWYQVVTEGGFLPGWVSTGPGDEWVRNFDLSGCPASANDSVEDRFLSDKPMQALACFGSGSLVLLGYWPTASEAQYDSPCPFGDTTSKWLVCYEFLNQSQDGVRSLAVYGTTELPDFERGRWYTVSGHFDDPRSSTCPEIVGGDTSAAAAASVLFCRTRFVADSVEPAPTP